MITGQEFARVKNLPAKWFVESVLIKVARAVSPSVEIGSLSAPSVLMPVAAMAQGIVVRPIEPSSLWKAGEGSVACQVKAMIPVSQ